MQKETETDILENISQRNPGAIDVCRQLFEQFHELAVFDLTLLKQYDIVGTELWNLYKYCCHSDIDILHSALMEDTAISKLQTCFRSKFYQG